MAAVPRVGERIRIAMLYGGEWRPLMWLRVGRDGSVYLGLLLGQPSFGLKGSATAGTVTQIKYNNGRPVAAEDLRKGSRVSFKASGDVHIGADVLKGEALETLSKSRQLCLALFVHPGRYRPPAKHSVRDFDVGIVDYPVDDARPLYASVGIAAWNGGSMTPPQPLRGMETWQAFAFGFHGLTRTPDLSLGVVIGHGIEGAWPELPHIVVADQEVET
jgi:hypothetical protein